MNIEFTECLNFLIGADKVEIENGKAIITFFENSDKYSCMAQALAFMKEYNSSDLKGKDVLIDQIKNLYDYFNEVLDRAKKMSFGLEFVFAEENQKIIDQMKEALIKKGKL